MSLDRLDMGLPRARIGLGLAAVGRPGYINIGHDGDLPADRSVAGLRARSHQLLDEAYAGGVRYIDVARSYGRGEEFLADWIARGDHLADNVGNNVADVVVGSKWGYTYTAGWRVDAEVHETKDHSVATFDRQLAETRALLGGRLDLYQIHSVTPESAALVDAALHRRLASLAADGVTIGLSVSGPAQGEAIRAALTVRVDGRPLFRSVQATWNLFERSAADALAEAHDAGCVIIVKEAMANGRLIGPDPAVRARPPGDPLSGDPPPGESPAAATIVDHIAAELATTPDAVALAAALHQPWAGIVLSGASTTAQLATNLAAAKLNLDARQLRLLAALAEPSRVYWQHRSRLPWT